MNYITHFHLLENISLTSIQAGVIDVIKGVDIGIYHGSSQVLRKQIIEGLQLKGWSTKVKLSLHSNISITSINLNVALCIQTGNMGRFYSDLLKLQYLYQKRRVNSAIYILPTKRLAKTMGSNLANYERLVSEVNLFREVITIPMLIIGMN